MGWPGAAAARKCAHSAATSADTSPGCEYGQAAHPEAVPVLSRPRMVPRSAGASGPADTGSSCGGMQGIEDTMLKAHVRARLRRQDDRRNALPDREFEAGPGEAPKQSGTLT